METIRFIKYLLFSNFMLLLIIYNNTYTPYKINDFNNLTFIIISTIY